MATEENTMNVVSNSLPATKNTVIRNATRDYLSTVDLNNIPLPDEIEAGIRMLFVQKEVNGKFQTN